MKGRITTVLSLTGVLVAGSAAAMVNTQVLQSTESKSSGQVTVGSTDNSNTPTSESTVAGDSATKIQSNVLTATQAMYQIGDAGLVTLDTNGDALIVVSVSPESGWTVVKSENYGSADVEVKLTNGTTIVEFNANLQLGVITTSVESKLVGSSGDGGSTPGSGSIDDDDGVDVDVDVDVTIGVEFGDDDDDGHGGDDD